jgi:hypothetical protein
MRRSSTLVLLIACLAPQMAFAEPSRIDQVERLDVERGESELEWESVFLPASASEPSVWAHVVSGEYGVSEQLSLGFELGALDEDGDHLSADYVVLQAKLVALDPAQSPFGLGAQVSLGPSLNGGSGEAELELLGETRWGALSVAADISFESELGHIDQALATRYALRADWPQRWGGFGVEAGGDLSTADDEEARHWMGPVMLLRNDRFALEVSDLLALNAATPDHQIRLQLDIAL